MLSNADDVIREGTPVHLGNNQRPVSMVTALADAGGPSKTRSRSYTESSDDVAALSVVTASRDRRHFYTGDFETGLTGFDNEEQKSSALSSSTPTSPTYLSSPPVANDIFDPMPTSLPSSAYSTPPTTPVSTHPIPLATPTKLTPNSKRQATVSRFTYIKNLLWQLYHFLLTLSKASFVPVTGRMITLLAKEQETRSPLSNALLCFVTEVTSKTMDKPWLCNERLQLGMLSLFGKQLDR